MMLTNNKKPGMFKARIVCAALIAAGASLAAQAQETSQLSQSPQLPRTTDGRPDLQGIWTNGTQTPL
ncbi:hypothetical protein, partial [Pseudohongiella sp.]